MLECLCALIAKLSRAAVVFFVCAGKALLVTVYFLFLSPIFSLICIFRHLFCTRREGFFRPI